MHFNARPPRICSLKRMGRFLGRYRKALMLRVVYGAATATGTTAVGLIVLFVQKRL